MTTTSIEPSLGLYYEAPPQAGDGDGEQTWITRSANVVVAVSRVRAGTVLARSDHPDEYLLLLPPGVRAELQTPAQTLAAPGDSLTIVPPGESRIRLLDDGLVTRVFSAQAADLATAAANAAVYAQGAPGVSPLQAWPMPVGGYCLRNYVLADYTDPKFFGRLFRTRHLMINVFERKAQARDPSKMSPHSHADFEQISLALEGRFVHHLRTPWGPDSLQWREDRHFEMDSPSTIVIPAGEIHTTAWHEGPSWLVDIFGPPRLDFSSQPGLVRNEAEYPMPA